MSRERYSSGSRGKSPYQDNSKATSTQQAIQDDSLTTDCLIRTLMEKGDMEEPILKTLFIGGSRPREGESENLLFRRMRNCWLERSRNYGMKELLKMKMKECGIDTDTDGKWAKYSLMKAPLIIVAKIWINRQGEQKRFQIDNLRDEKYLSECAMYLQKNGYPSAMSKYIDANIIGHRWDQFPDRDPYVYRSQQSKRTFHLIKDGLAIYHHVILHRNQMDQLEAIYKDKNNKGIQLVQQDWSSFICNTRGKKKLIIANERKSSRSYSVESSEVRQILEHWLNRRGEQDKLQAQVIVVEGLSDQESQRNREIEKGLKIDSNVVSQVWSQGQHKEELLQDIRIIEEVINLAKRIGMNQFFRRRYSPMGLLSSRKRMEQIATQNYSQNLILNTCNLTQDLRRTLL